MNGTRERQQGVRDGSCGSFSAPKGLVRRVIPAVLSLAVATALGACSAETANTGAAGGAGVRAFTNANIFDGTGAPLIENGVILVQNGRVTEVGSSAEVSVPEGAEVVDLGGRYVVPGFINAHGHVEDPTGEGPSVQEQLDTYAYYGVTTVLSLGETPPDALPLRANRDRADIGSARLWAAGPIYTPMTVDSAVAAVNRLADMNVDWVKLRVDSFVGTAEKIPPDVYRAAIETASQHNLPVAVHLVELEDAKGVVEAGAALVAHSVRDRAVDDELINMMRDRNVCVVPTLTRELSTFVYAERPDFFDDPFFLERAAPDNIDSYITPELQASQTSEAAEYYKNGLPIAEQNMIRMRDAGIGIAFGTDSGTRFPGRFQGYLEHLEMEMMVDAGMTPAEVLHSATGQTASCIGLEGEVGTLQPGAWADMVVLDANPLENIRNTREIRSIWIGGNLLREAQG